MQFSCLIIFPQNFVTKLSNIEKGWKNVMVNTYAHHQDSTFNILLYLLYHNIHMCISPFIRIYIHHYFTRCFSKWIAYMILNIFYPNTSVFYPLIWTSDIDASLKSIFVQLACRLFFSFLSACAFSLASGNRWKVSSVFMSLGSVIPKVQSISHILWFGYVS